MTTEEMTDYKPTAFTPKIYTGDGTAEHQEEIVIGEDASEMLSNLSQALMHNNHVAFDIETTWRDDTAKVAPPFDPSKVALGNRTDPKKIEAHIAKAAEAHIPNIIAAAPLDAKYGRVAMFTYCELDKTLYSSPHPITLVAWNDQDEFQLLQAIAGMFKAHAQGQGAAYGFNICSFDLRFIIQRMIIQGVPFFGPAFFNRGQGDNAYRLSRYWADRYVDLRDAWMMPVRSRMDAPSGNSLDNLLRVMEGSMKTHKGSEVPRMVRNRDENCIRYALDEMSKLSGLIKRFHDTGLL